MKTHSWFLFLLLCCARIMAQNGSSILWQKCLGGSEYDVAKSIQQTTDGGYIVAGYSSSNDGDVSDNHGNHDYWIVKLDSSANIQWQKSFGGTVDDDAQSIQQTIDGGYIVAGSSKSNDGDVSGNHGYGDYWIVKLDFSGNIEWQKSLGGSGGDYAYSVQQTSDRGYIVAGTSSSNDGDVSGNHGSWDYWIVKLDSTASIQWQKSLGGTDDEYGYSIHQTSDDGFIVAGSSESNDGDVSGNHAYSDYWIVKLDFSGSFEWQKSLGGSTSDVATSIQQTNDDGFIVAGYSWSDDGDISNHDYYSDYWIVKLDSSANIQWEKSLGGSDNDYGGSIQQTDNGFIVAGQSFSGNGDVSDNHGLTDYWVTTLDSSGNIQLEISLGGSEDDGPACIQQTSDGAFIIAGVSYSNDEDVTGNHGKGDYWIVKVKMDGCAVQKATIKSLGNLDICENGFVKLVANSGNNFEYQWSRNGVNVSNGTEQIFKAKKTGNYQVTISIGGCLPKTSKKVKVYSSCKLGEVTELTSSLNIYPNPTIGTFTLDLQLDDEETSDAQVQVLNMIGQAVSIDNVQLTIDNGRLVKEIHLGDVAEGMYLVKVTVNEKVFTTQIDLQK